MKTFSRRQKLEAKALERQQHISEALSEPSYFHPDTPAAQNAHVKTRTSAAASAQESPVEVVPPEVLLDRNAEQPTRKYSRKAVPSNKQQEQAANAQHMQAMKEYFAEVDDFELAEETPTKQPVSSPPPPLPASPEVTDLQLPHAKIPISADRRTAEWLTALSPVMESDEGTPGLADTPNTTEPSTAGAAPSSPVNPGMPERAGDAHAVKPAALYPLSAQAKRKSCYGLSRRASMVVAPRRSMAIIEEDPHRKASLGPSLLQHLGSRFSLANGLSRLSTTLGLPDALHRLGLTAPVEVSTAAPQQQADTHTRVAASDAGVAPARAGSVNTRFASSQDAAATAAVDAAVMHEEDVGWQPDEQSSQQYAEHATQHPDQHGGLDQARETRQTAKTHQQSHSHSVVGKTSSLSRPAQQHRSQQEALGEEFVDENQPDEVQTVRQQRRDSVARMPLQAMQASSLHTEDPDAIQQKSFRSHGSSLQSQHSPGHAHAAQTENRPEQASQHTQRAAKASRTSGIAPQQQSGVDSQAADALTAGQQRPPGMGQTAGASSNADCLQLPQLKAQVPPSIGGLPEQAMHSLEQTEQQGLTQSKQQGLSQLEPLRLSLGTQPQHAPSEHQEPCSGSAVQEVDAVCSQLAASTMESVELNSMQQLLQLCGQDTNIQLLPSMADLLSQHASLGSIRKIGEGTFGEAFKADQVVFKIVPLEGSPLVNGEVQKRSEEILAEVAIALTLSRLRDPTDPGGNSNQNITEGFVQTHGLGICRGVYAEALTKEWHRWDRLHESENDPVDAFPGDQLYVVFVVANGGADLEHFELRSFQEAQSLLMQTALSLAVAEQACQFEHRDLHWGNLLVQRDSNKAVACRLRGHDIQVASSGVTVTLIDFTLSRLTTVMGDVAFCNLAADPELFAGPKGDVQADTYRRMKKAIKNQWQCHCPATNCLWMGYTADIILNLKAFPMTAQQKKLLRGFRKQALGSTSCAELIWDEFFQGIWLAGQSD